MIRLASLTPALLLVLLAGPTAAQVSPTEPSATSAPAAPVPAAALPVPPAPLPPTPPLPRVILVTSAGTITVTLEKTKAPATVANFLKYVDLKRFDGASFYRALAFPAPASLGLIQGGLRGRSDKVLPPVRHEPTSTTGLTHDDGAISMARGAPGTANADFFIILGNLNGLDANAKEPGYAVFGRVTEGMDVIRAIQAAPVSATAGEGAMKGQMLLKPVTIMSARRISAAAVVPAPAAAQSPR
jgi:peptidyl-prolyl cis-trans isomerase A (cyclophilin A)